jgi:N-formylglutamate deformylase
MTQTILHIPHSSNHIPFYDGYIPSNEVLEKEILKLTDWYTDELFSIESLPVVKADFSRVFCDVERFADDAKEEMAKHGMGMLYTSLDNGGKLRGLTPDLRQRIYEGFYKPHHEKLEYFTQKALDEFGQVLIVDCHSFSHVPFHRDLDQSTDRPEICIGTDEYHTPVGLVVFVKEYFEAKGYECALNAPYSGSIVPTKYYKSEGRVCSIMIEINRDLYLLPNSNKKNTNFMHVRRDISDLIDLLRTRKL